MKTLVTGSIAYDTIMVFPDRFRNHLLPDQLHILNVCFLTPQMRREYGGTAGNIAYNLRLLDEDPLVMATVGEDVGPYLERLRGLRIGTEHLRRIPGQFTAQAFITTDLDDNQITAFHPGAMNYSHENHVTRALGATLAIISPDGKEGMLQHARECAKEGIAPRVREARRVRGGQRLRGQAPRRTHRTHAGRACPGSEGPDLHHGSEGLGNYCRRSTPRDSLR